MFSTSIYVDTFGDWKMSISRNNSVNVIECSRSKYPVRRNEDFYAILYTVVQYKQYSYFVNFSHISTWCACVKILDLKKSGTLCDIFEVIWKSVYRIPLWKKIIRFQLSKLHKMTSKISWRIYFGLFSQRYDTLF